MAKTQTVYGIHAVEKLFKQAPDAIYTLFFVKGRLNNRQQQLHDQAKKLGLNIEQQPKSFFDKSELNHQGVAALVEKQRDLTEKDLMEILASADQPLILFLDEVQDPHNLGAILRTADATGVDAVVIPKHQSVGMNATVKKVACGAAETVKLIVVSNLVRTVQALQKEGLWVTGLAGETDSTIYQQNFKGAVGIVMGSEGSGLRRLTREACDNLAAIPMVGSVESLNVSVATGVTLYEVLRQRSMV